jgi:hypothetical protein
MFVRSRVKHKLRVRLLQYFRHSLWNRHIADGGDDRGPWILPSQFKVEGKQAVLITLKEDQRSRVVSSDLPAELSADRSPGTGYKHSLPLEQRMQFLPIHLDGFPL